MEGEEGWVKDGGGWGRTKVAQEQCSFLGVVDGLENGEVGEEALFRQRTGFGEDEDGDSLYPTALGVFEWSGVNLVPPELCCPSLDCSRSSRRFGLYYNNHIVDGYSKDIISASRQIPTWLLNSTPVEFLESMKKNDAPLNVKYLQTLVECLCMLGKVAAAGPIIWVFGTVGHPINHTEIKIVDIETGAALPNGSKGIVEIRGPPVMKGYYKNPSATNEALNEDRWFNTGDIGWMRPKVLQVEVVNVVECLFWKAVQRIL